MKFIKLYKMLNCKELNHKKKRVMNNIFTEIYSMRIKVIKSHYHFLKVEIKITSRIREI